MVPTSLIGCVIANNRENSPMPDKPATLYTRLGGYDAIAAVVDDPLPRLRSDVLLSRFWTSPPRFPIPRWW